MHLFLYNYLIICTFILITIIPIKSEAVDSLTYSSGRWTSVSGSSFMGINTPQIRWGVPIDDDAGISGMSSYLYEPAAFPIAIEEGTQFKIGTFHHFNNEIFGSSINSAVLTLGLGLNIGGRSINPITMNVTLKHQETSNITGSGCCDDLVNLVLGTNTRFDFTIDNVDYHLELLGFYLGDEVVTSFITPESNVGVADFLAVLTATNQPTIQPVPPEPIVSPEPETYVILAGTLLFILLKKGRRKRKVQEVKFAFMEKQLPTFFLGRFWKR